MFSHLMCKTLQAAVSHTHACTRRHGPSSRWATNRTRSRWGCCTEWTWRCGRCAPPPAEGDRGRVLRRACQRFSLFFLTSDLQHQCPSSAAFSVQVSLPAAMKRDTSNCCCLIKTKKKILGHKENVWLFQYNMFLFFNNILMAWQCCNSNFRVKPEKNNHFKVQRFSPYSTEGAAVQRLVLRHKLIQEDFKGVDPNGNGRLPPASLLLPHGLLQDVLEQSVQVFVADALPVVHLRGSRQESARGQWESPGPSGRGRQMDEWILRQLGAT